ncbi:hypothetical protein M121_4724 [Bacteroides fragilis str. 3783N2-1]|nr:hypothetical protein M121_4724 [Bacteroides fragilis str. 3783N2-1]
MISLILTFSLVPQCWKRFSTMTATFVSDVQQDRKKVCFIIRNITMEIPL